MRHGARPWPRRGFAAKTCAAAAVPGAEFSEERPLSAPESPGGSRVRRWAMIAALVGLAVAAVIIILVGWDKVVSGFLKIGWRGLHRPVRHLSHPGRHPCRRVAGARSARQVEELAGALLRPAGARRLWRAVAVLVARRVRGRRARGGAGRRRSGDRHLDHGGGRDRRVHWPAGLRRARRCPAVLSARSAAAGPGADVAGRPRRRRAGGGGVRADPAPLLRADRARGGALGPQFLRAARRGHRLAALALPAPAAC